MNFARLRHLQFNSPVARRALSLYYRPGKHYRIPFGPLRNLKFYYDRSINYHAVLGFWDGDTINVLKKVLVERRQIEADPVVADVGGNVGYVTLWLSRYVAGRGRVYAFEPSPAICRILRSNVEANRLENVEIVELACGDRNGTAEFFVGAHHHSSSLHESWAKESRDRAEKLTVEMTTLDAFFAPSSGRGTPAFIKIDIEGGGTAALPGCERILREARPLVLVESHMPDEDRAISDVLTRHRYDGFRLNTKSWVTKREAVHPEPDGVWGTVLLVPRERRAALEAVIGA